MSLKLGPNTEATNDGEQPIAGAVTGAIGRLLAVDAIADHHVEPVGEQPLDHGRRARRVVGGVAIDQHVDVGFDVGEHAPHHVALALALFLVDFGAGGARRRCGIVGRIVVEDEDGRARQRGAEVLDDFRDRHRFVVAGHQDRDRIWAEVAGVMDRRRGVSLRQLEAPLALAACRIAVNRQFNALAPLTQRFYAPPPFRPRETILAVIVPFESPQGASLTQLADLVAPDMERVNTTILARTGSEVTMIPEVANHLIASGGKRLRPMLTLAMAKLAGYSGDGHIKFAAAVEFMHTATLLHDDVVDESDMRRGKLAARMLWGNEASVLVGDFLLGQAFKMMVEVGNLHALDILSSAAAVIAEGEVMQLGAAKNTATNEDEYLAVIRAKTAELFAAACEVGPALAGKDKAELAACRSFGMNLGIAFQLIDDALDYGGKSAKLGKNVGDDFREGKITLPVVLSFRRGTRKRARLLGPHARQGRNRRRRSRHRDGADGQAPRHRGHGRPRPPLRRDRHRRAGAGAAVGGQDRAGRSGGFLHRAGALARGDFTASSNILPDRDAVDSGCAGPGPARDSGRHRRPAARSRSAAGRAAASR